MKLFVMSFMLILASGCGLDEYEYENGYQHHPRVHVHPSRDYHGERYNRNESHYIEVPATPGYRGQPSQPGASNQHGHDDSNNQHGHDNQNNQHGHYSVPGYSDATPSVQDTRVHTHQ